MPRMNNFSEGRWLSRGQVLTMLAISSSTLDRWSKDDFPKPIRLGRGRGTLRWKQEAIERFLAEREARTE